MTPIEKNATLAHALALWMSSGSDYAILRHGLWYPSSTPGLCGKQSRNENASEMLEDDCDDWAVSCVEGAFKSLTKAQQKALERHLGASDNWAMYAMEQPDLPPAYLAYVHRLIPGMPAVARTRRITEAMLEEWLAPRYQVDLDEAMNKVWRALVANGCGS